MSEATTVQTLSSKRLRLLGYGLLVFGFLWLGLSATTPSMDVRGAMSRFFAERYPTSYAPANGRELSRQWQGVRDGLPWVFTPALLMFGGALIVVLVPAKRR